MDPHPVAHAYTPRAGGLERADPAWERAWSHVPDPVLAHPESGACLQYMGSTQAPGGDWVHGCRHRQVPGGNQRQSWRVPASCLTPAVQGRPSRSPCLW
jgi:hypothetical protein